MIGELQPPPSPNFYRSPTPETPIHLQIQETQKAKDIIYYPFLLPPAMSVGCCYRMFCSKLFRQAELKPEPYGGITCLTPLTQFDRVQQPRHPRDRNILHRSDGVLTRFALVCTFNDANFLCLLPEKVFSNNT